MTEEKMLKWNKNLIKELGWEGHYIEYCPNCEDKVEEHCIPTSELKAIFTAKMPKTKKKSIKAYGRTYT